MKIDDHIDSKREKEKRTKLRKVYSRIIKNRSFVKNGKEHKIGIQ